MNLSRLRVRTRRSAHGRHLHPDVRKLAVQLEAWLQRSSVPLRGGDFGTGDSNVPLKEANDKYAEGTRTKRTETTRWEVPFSPRL